MQADDRVLLLLREAAPLQVGAEVVDPPQPAALAAPLQPCELGHGAPAPDTVTDDVIVELLVFLGRPEPLAQLLLDSAAGGRVPSHSRAFGSARHGWPKEGMISIAALPSPSLCATVRSSPICRERPGVYMGKRAENCTSTGKRRRPGGEPKQ
uniref:Uncharacterized protein n=1 Tax=Arundo donax TaxID=35708 RepID=A0A0A9GGI7_ARUDO